jgi:bifunctional UDP-N-acetylglucosamine pyrophosphorylase / glucosamine-1-phosphate N-acetyltransferase
MAMNDDFSPSYFFELDEFEHRALFDGCLCVWEALSNIDHYLRNIELGRIEIDIPPGVYLEHPELISIGEGSIVEPGAFIRGPCVIGKRCQIRHGAYIRGEVIAGSGCVIGHTTEIKHSILLNRVSAAHFAYVGDCILGNGVNLGAGTKCANLKLDGSMVDVRVGGRRVNSGLRKFGAVMGDETSVGCNSVPNPGTVLGRGVRAYACTNFGGFVASASVIRHPEPCATPL